MCSRQLDSVYNVTEKKEVEVEFERTMVKMNLTGETRGGEVDMR